MLKPLEQWCCDTCGDVICGPQEGCVEWHTTHRTNTTSGFRIVHRSSKCTYRGIELATMGRTSTLLPLVDALYPSGLGHMLGLLEEAVMEGSVRGEALNEFIELLRRLHIPYYEEARLAWQAGLKEGLHDGTKYDNATLRHLIHWKDAAVAAWVASVTGEDTVPRSYEVMTTNAGA
ncbi:hypothetical protein ACFLUT_04385 [Chloroflexota bacterium]